MSEQKKALASRWRNFKKAPEKANETQKDSWISEEFTLMFHTPNFSTADVIIKQDIFSGVKEKEILEITPNDSNYSSFVVQISAESFITKAVINLSINSQLASVLGMASLRSLEVRVRRLCSSDYDCNELLMSIKDQHICRSDIWKCCELYRGMAVYKGQIISKSGFRATTTQLMGKKELSTAVITKDTKITFRTKSCRMVYLIEMSKEMWEFSPSGILYWEKMIAFLTTAFERQLLRRLTHDISIVIYCKLIHGKEVTNVYREIMRISDLRNSWIEALKILRKEIMFFPAMINWEFDLTQTAKSIKELFPINNYKEFDKQEPTHPSLNYFRSDIGPTNKPCSLSPANESSILESLNYTLTCIESQDSKNCTGNSIMVISASTGLYYTSHPLAKVTKMRVLAQGTTINLMSMKHYPMHSYPLFIFDKELFTQKTFHTSLDLPEGRITSSFMSKTKAKPSWLNVHFFFSFLQLEATCNLQSPMHLQTHERHKKFQPLFRLPGVTGLGLPHISRSVGDEIKLENHDLQKAISGLKFQLAVHDTKIFLRKPSLTSDESPHNVIYRKWSSSNQNDELNRKDTMRRESFLDTQQQRESLLGNTSIHYVMRKAHSSFSRRWTACFRILKEMSEETLKDEQNANSKNTLEYYESVWNSILEPCLLPLVNDFWPQAKDLGVSQPYNFYVGENTSRETAINRIIGSRLNRGFQIVTKRAFDSFGMKIIPPDIALSLGATYHVIIPDSNDDFTLVYMVNCPKAATVQNCTILTTFDTEKRVYSESDHQFTFTYPTTWDEEDSKMLGH